MLWIGGAQWAGKTTVADLVARDYGLTACHYDNHSARGHQDRLIARRVARGEPLDGPSPDAVWVDQSPEAMAAETMAESPVRFEWTLDDLRALFTGRPAIAEGCALRGELSPCGYQGGRIAATTSNVAHTQRKRVLRLSPAAARTAPRAPGMPALRRSSR